jgi:hypothetical protein
MCLLKTADDRVFIAVGAGLIVPNEDEIKKGRILLFKINEEKAELELVTVKEVEGGVYSMVQIRNSLAAAVNNKVRALTNVAATLRYRLEWN